MKRLFAQAALALAVLTVFSLGAYSSYRRWQARQPSGEAALEVHPAHARQEEPRAPSVVELSAQAQKNLGLIVKPIKPTTYWRSIELPALLVERAGMSDVGVIAPITGVVSQIFSHPGETLAPGSKLFTLRLTSESLHASQRELYKAAREIEIAKQQRQRLQSLAQDGALAQNRLIEIDNTLDRLSVTAQAYRQELLARGITTEQIDEIAKGTFVTEITIHAPLAAQSHSGETPLSKSPPFRYEFEQLSIALGEQAEAGQLLCRLADHRNLLIEGHGFKDDLPLVQRAAKEGLPIQLELEKREGLDWPPSPSHLHIHHIDNSIDVEKRTFDFHLVLENQWQTFTQDDHTGVLWRYQPGDRVRLSIAIEQIDNVFIVPREAAVREGAEAFVFRENGPEFRRQAVHIVAEDRKHVIIAADGSLVPGLPIALNAAASLNRILQSQSSGGHAEEHHHDH